MIYIQLVLIEAALSLVAVATFRCVTSTVARVLLGSGSVVALGFACLVVLMTSGPVERSQMFWDKPLSVQLTVTSEIDPFPYQQGLVVVPTVMPLPFFTGDTIARANMRTRVSVDWEGAVLVVAATAEDGSPASVLCGAGSVRGATVRYVQPAPVEACPVARS